MSRVPCRVCARGGGRYSDTYIVHVQQSVWGTQLQRALEHGYDTLEQLVQ
jgi:hypothetical protein